MQNKIVLQIKNPIIEYFGLLIFLECGIYTFKFEQRIK